MTAIPDSFNMSELSNMLENAPQEDDLHAAVANNADKELTPEQMEALAEEVLEYAYSKCTDPLVHKVVAMRVIHNMVEWHMQVAAKQYEDGNEQSGAAWMRDAGKFQAVMNILATVTVGPEDFTCV